MIKRYYPSTYLMRPMGYHEFEGDKESGPELDWVSFYMGLAFAVKEKSKDRQTKHGCILVDKFWRPISFGFNGFVRGIRDNLVPKTRPEKYPFVANNHSENNAIRNARIDLMSEPEVKAFISGEPCKDCVNDLIQNNILIWYVAKRSGFTSGDNSLDRKIKDFYITERDVRVYYVDVEDAQWINQISF